MQELAHSMERLATAVERLLEAQERREREQRAERMRLEWESPLRPFGLGPLLRGVPGLAAQFDHIVPDDFTALTGDGEVTVACPCGEAPTVRSGRLVGCQCGRWFLNDGRHIRVALSPSGGNRSGPPADPRSTNAEVDGSEHQLLTTAAE